MPFLKKIAIEDGIIGFWEISEKPDELEQQYPEFTTFAEYKKLTSEKRRTEFLVVRALLSKLTSVFSTIVYRKNGAPYLQNEDLNISISHSATLVAIILNKKRAGIDVEILGRKVERIADKFLSGKELEFARQSPEPEICMTLLWSAKEAVYKCIGKSGVEFKKQILVGPFNPSGEGKMKATYISRVKQQEMALDFFFMKNNAVVWCVL
jgi:4'-phosphopantetheinyl transferase